MCKQILYPLFLGIIIALSAGKIACAHHEEHEPGLAHHWEVADYRRETDWQIKGLGIAFLAVGGWKILGRRRPVSGRRP